MGHPPHEKSKGFLDFENKKCVFLNGGKSNGFRRLGKNRGFFSRGGYGIVRPKAEKKIAYIERSETVRVFYSVLMRDFFSDFRYFLKGGNFSFFYQRGQSKGFRGL